VIVYLDDKRRPLAQMTSKIQHAVAGFPLLMLGLHKLQEGEELPVGILEVAIGAIVLGTFIMELRAAVRHAKHGPQHGHSTVGWFDLAAGGMLIFEAVHAPPIKPFYFRATFCTGVVTILLGLLHHRLQARKAKRQYFRIDDEGIRYRYAFRSWSIGWDELKTVDLSESEAVFETTGGKRRRVNLGRLHNHEAVRRAVMDHPGAAKLIRG
jgi:hypothetical protein